MARNVPKTIYLTEHMDALIAFVADREGTKPAPLSAHLIEFGLRHKHGSLVDEFEASLKKAKQR